jgi:GNAT superfamily N-acetyltransferase
VSGAPAGALAPAGFFALASGEVAVPAVAAFASEAAPALPEAGEAPLGEAVCALAIEPHTAIPAAITQLAACLIFSPPTSALVLSQTAQSLLRFTNSLTPRVIVHLSMDAQPTTTTDIRLDEINADTAPETLSAARELLLEYGQFVIAHPESAGFCYGTLEQEAARLPFSYLEKQGGCLLAHVNDEPAGFVAWRAVPTSVAADAWELKRLWVRPLTRGVNLGRALTQAVIDRAVLADRTAIYLDTVPVVMATAHRLYLSMGFAPCPPYNNQPVAGLEWMVKRL